IRVAQPSAVLFTDLIEASINRHAGVVHPGIDPAKLTDGCVSRALAVLAFGDVAADRQGYPSFGVNLLTDFVQCLFATRRQHKLCPAFGGGHCGAQANAAGSAGDHHHLLIEWFESDGHDCSLCESSTTTELKMQLVCRGIVT